MRGNLPRGARIFSAVLPVLLSLPGSGEAVQQSAARASDRSSAHQAPAASLRILAERPVLATAEARTAPSASDEAPATDASALGTYEYAPIVIEPLAGQALSRAYGLNNAGQVVGRSFNFDAVNQVPVNRTALVWDPVRGSRSLPTLSGESGAWGLSNSGQASGFAYTASGFPHAVRWDTVPRTPTVADLGTLHNTATLQPGPSSTAYDLNDHGDVTGYSDLPNDARDFTPFHALLYAGSGPLQDLGTFDTANPYYQFGYSISYSANTDGQVVGLANTSGWLFRPFVYDASVGLREIPIDPAYSTSEWHAVAINDSGVIGGHVVAAAGHSLPYYWTSETTAPVALPMPASFPYGEIYSVNAQGVMVGAMWNDAQQDHAFLFDTVSGVRDLNSLIDPALGWTLEFARDINATGQISGSGSVNGLARGYLLTPSALVGAVEGTVLHGVTGNAVAGVQVRLYAAAGRQVAQAVTDAQGRYTISPLLPGTYFAIATNPLGGTDQLYSGRPCSACDPTTGSSIAVAAGVTTPSINFSIGPPAGGPVAVVWTSLVGVTANGNSLTKTAVTGWGNAGAASTQQIASGDGYVEFTASETTTHRMLGLSNGNTNVSQNDIDFALYEHARQIRVYEGGILRGSFGKYSPGDTLRVAVVGGVVKYSRNGSVFYSSAKTPTFPLLVDAALKTEGATISNAVITGAQ